MSVEKIIIKNKDTVRKSYTVLYNSLLQDSRMDHRTRGLLGELLSRPEDWEISLEGTMSTNQKDRKTSITSGFKQAVKYGYLVRIPQSRDEKGQFTTSELHVFQTPQIEEPLTDEQVDKLFEKHVPYSEIQKIYPKLISRHRFSDTEIQPQQSKDKQSFSKEKQQEQKKAAAASFQENDENQPKYDRPQDPNPLIEPMSDQAKGALRRVGMDNKMIEDLEKYYFSNQEIEAAANHAAKSKTQKHVGWFVKCIQEKWYIDRTTKPCETTNKQIAMEYVRNVKSNPRNVNIDALNTYIEFASFDGTKTYDTLNYETSNFEHKLQELFKKWKICSLQYST